MSLIEIGDLENRDPSTISYWLGKFGLEANGKAKHSPRGELRLGTLKPMVDRGMTVAAIADSVDRSPGAVRYWLEKYGLSTKAKRGSRPVVPRDVVQRAIRDGQRTLDAVCLHHGPSVFVIENSGRARCRQCRMERVAARRRKVKRILIEEAGGACVRCGFDGFVGALQFHHLDPSNKKFGVAARGATIGIDALRVEASKCVLLCANCHAEVEHGGASLTLE